MLDSVVCHQIRKGLLPFCSSALSASHAEWNAREGRADGQKCHRSFAVNLDCGREVASAIFRLVTKLNVVVAAVTKVVIVFLFLIDGTVTCGVESDAVELLLADATLRALFGMIRAGSDEATSIHRVAGKVLVGIPNKRSILEKDIFMKDGQLLQEGAPPDTKRLAIVGEARGSLWRGSIGYSKHTYARS